MHEHEHNPKKNEKKNLLPLIGFEIRSFKKKTFILNLKVEKLLLFITLCAPSDLKVLWKNFPETSENSSIYFQVATKDKFLALIGP